MKDCIKNNSHGLEIQIGVNGMSIWYPDNEFDRKKFNLYLNKTKKERENSLYGKKLKFVQDFNESLFSEKSSRSVGVSKAEFRDSEKIIEYVQDLLDKKDEPTKKVVEPKISKTKETFISVLLTMFLSWVVSWFVEINIYLIVVIAVGVEVLMEIYKFFRYK